MDKNLMSAEEASLISANKAASLSEDARIKKTYLLFFDRRLPPLSEV